MSTSNDFTSDVTVPIVSTVGMNWSDHEPACQGCVNAFRTAAIMTYKITVQIIQNWNHRFSFVVLVIFCENTPNAMQLNIFK